MPAPPDTLEAPDTVRRSESDEADRWDAAAPGFEARAPHTVEHNASACAVPEKATDDALLLRRAGTDTSEGARAAEAAPAENDGHATPRPFATQHAADDKASDVAPDPHAPAPAAADAHGIAAQPNVDDAPDTRPDPALFAHALRIAEALVFASDRPVTPARLGGALPPACDARAVLTALAAACAGRSVELVEVGGGFTFRTAPELAPAITRVVEVPRRLPKAAMETLAIVAYHQPVTRAEIEEIRGASLSQSTLETLLDAALIAPRGRKEVPGRPSLWGTTPRFLEQFGLKALGDLPRREELVNEPTLPLSAPPPPQDAAPPPPEA